jgi:adenosylcobinamide-GDP ribazoletransferase
MIHPSFTAFGFLTRIPVPASAADADLASALPWFPLAGMAIGLLLSSAAAAGLQIDPWLGALAALLAWVGITGALHLDGLADLADALGAAHKDSAGLLRVMKDPHVGAFAVTAIAAQLLVKLVALRLYLESFSFFALVAVPMVARVGPLYWARFLPALGTGLAKRLSAGATLFPILLWTAAIGCLGAAFPWLLGGLIVFALWALYLKYRVGGISGDGYGAGIEISESVLLLLAVCYTRL